MKGLRLAIYVTCSTALLTFSCAETSPPAVVAAPIAVVPAATATMTTTTSGSPNSDQQVVPASSSSSTNPRDDVRAEIRRREDADVDFVARGYGDQHPARLVLRAELESLRASDKAWTANSGAREARVALLRSTEAGLLAAGRGESHPDVIAVRAKIHAAETSP